VRSSDIEALTVPHTLALRGDLLLAALSRPDLTTNTYLGSLRKVGFDGVETPWTHSVHDSAPSISPDGRWVAFLRAGEGEGAAGKPQLHVMPAAGGDAKRLTEAPLGVGAPAWAPDSRRVAFTARVPGPGRYGTPGEDGEPVERAEEAPRRITRLDYRIDNIGFLGDRPQRLFALDAVAALDAVELPEPTPLTDDTVDVQDPAWTPDGERILVVAPRDWGRVETENADLYAIPAEGGAPKLVLRSAGAAAKPVVADGVVWFLAAEFPGGSLEARNTGLWAAPLPEPGGLAEARRLTEVESVDCDGAAGAPVLFGDEVLVAVRNHGAVELRAVAQDSSLAPLDQLRLLAGEHAAVHAFAAHGQTVAAVVATPESAGDVVLIGPDDQKVLTDYSKSLRDKGLRPIEELTATSADGYPVHGWLLLPDGEGPHPVLLVVHGGPFAAQDWGVFDEAQVYASAGYAVVLGNPRGSAGYGQSHGRAIVRGFGTVDADDVLALLDAALARPDLDTDRVGVMGGSYGGFMTGWLAAHHGERFRAAWGERAVNAWDSMAGSSDIGYLFVQGYIGPDPVEQRRASPLTYAGKIDIPFMVVHSEEDWRCPLEQGQRMFVALRQAGVDAEFLLFPGEGHELTRSGKPRHRVQRFEAVLEWWSRHLLNA
jgi:dipeptidyl aminopeptidase/acylaminoacyl peptidase